ncbi:MAG: Polysaccharide deacetylase [Polaromonas sp.]|nr:Polysaccharide deacetylase [Polaromonas sp.]
MVSPMNEDPRIAFDRYEWPEGKRCAVILSIDVDAESPYLRRSGETAGTSIGELEQRRYGPRQGMARLLQLFEKHEVAVSCYVPGIVAETYPELLPRILRGGHEAALHGYLHERVDHLHPKRQEEYLAKSLEIFKAQTGLTELGYRSPSFEHSASSLALLKKRGITYDSSLMGFDHPYEVDGVLELPAQWTLDDILYFAYTENRRDKLHPANPNAVYESWVEEFEAAKEYGSLMMVTVHDWVSGRPQRLRLLDRLLTYMRRSSDVWFATSAEIADFHRRSSNAGRFAVTSKVNPFPKED